MQRRQFTAAAGGMGLAGMWLPGSAWAGLFDQADARIAVKTALERGAVAAVGLLGREGGFLDNPKVRIPLPKTAEKAAKGLRFIGQGDKVDELITAMNRAAEAAVPEGQALLVEAVKAMTLDDAVKIVQGGDTSVTTFFSDKTRQPLSSKFLPIVTAATEKVSLVDKYNKVAGKAASFGWMNAQDSSLQGYVTRKALDGLYLMIGEEEKKIRQDPVGTGSDILKKVFGR